MKLRIDDKVMVVAGKDKGQEGKITQVFPKTNKVIVEGLNKFKRHIKRQSDDQPGGIIEVERPLPASNVQLICPNCQQITRVGFEITKSGDKIRMCKKCQKAIVKKTKEAKKE